MASGKFAALTDIATYSAEDYHCVAHDFGQRASLKNMDDVTLRIQTLIANTRQLVLFINFEEVCTIEEVRQVIGSELPNLTFRIIYPRSVHRAPGVKVILIQKRRPRIFLFLSAAPTAGKTETALVFRKASSLTVVHGDEYFHGVLDGNIAASHSLRVGLRNFHSSAPFDRSLFAQFIALMPALKQDEDVAFDFIVPAHMHLDIAEYFEERGFFPVLCMTSADRKLLSGSEQQVARLELELQRYRAEVELQMAEAEAERQQTEGTVRALVHSTSWKITAPLRYLGRQFPALARRTRRVLRSE